MSGASRKTKYRKHVENNVLFEFPEPKDDEVIVEVVNSRGGNVFEVRNERGQCGLCLLPTKFRKLVWVKRGAFLIAKYSDQPYDTVSGKNTGKVKYTMSTVLFKDQIKNLQQRGLWPQAFRASGAGESQAVDAEVDGKNLSEDGDGNGKEEDGDRAMHDDDLFVNRNRQAMVYDSSSEESSEGDEDD